MEVTQEVIDAWKQEYGSVFVLRHPACDVYYRALTRQDYISILQRQMTGITVSDPELETIKTCVLNGVKDEVFEKVGGLATVVYEQIMLNSGFVQIESEQL